MKSKTHQTSNIDPEYIDKPTLAKMLGISERSVERRIDKRELPQPIRIGRLLRWRRQIITDYLAQQERAAQRQ